MYKKDVIDVINTWCGRSGKRSIHEPGRETWLNLSAEELKGINKEKLEPGQPTMHEDIEPLASVYKRRETRHSGTHP